VESTVATTTRETTFYWIQITHIKGNNKMSSAFDAMNEKKIHQTLKKELTHLMNKYGMGTRTNIPDRVLTDYILNCIDGLETLEVERKRPEAVIVQNKQYVKG
jgi:CheY-like chemotaxis protein